MAAYNYIWMFPNQMERDITDVKLKITGAIKDGGKWKSEGQIKITVVNGKYNEDTSYTVTCQAINDISCTRSATFSIKNNCNCDGKITITKTSGEVPVPASGGILQFSHEDVPSDCDGKITITKTSGEVPVPASGGILQFTNN